MDSNDPSVNELFVRDPLVALSVYTHSQVETLRDLAASITEILDRSFDEQAVDGENVREVYGRFWLWTIGAFEVIRTMAAAGACFAGPINKKLARLKKRLAIVRTPFAKQQRRILLRRYTLSLQPKAHQAY